MSTDGLFFSALQPKSTVTTYGLPSDVRLGNGGSSMSDEVSKARRVQEQVQMRLAQKSTLPRQNGSTTQYAMSGKRGLARFVCLFYWLVGWFDQPGSVCQLAPFFLPLGWGRAEGRRA